MPTLRIINSADDVTEHVLVLVTNCVEDWFSDDPISEVDFIERLCVHYGNNDGWDIEHLDTPAVRKIMRHVRRVRREMA